MIFLDTSAIYALADVRDPQHKLAKGRFEALLKSGEGILTHNYVILESIVLIQHRLGLTPALKFAHSSRAFDIAWVDRAIHEEAVQRLGELRRRYVSLVDHVSFLIMRSRGVQTALAFDPDFAAEGFLLYDGEG